MSANSSMAVPSQKTSTDTNKMGRYVAVLGFFLFSTLLLTWPLARSFGTAIPGDAFDGWQNFWNLWWVKEALLEQHSHPYVTDALYHPTGVSLWFQTINIFNGLASLPIQLAGNLFWAYNAVVLFSFAVAGFGATLLALYVLCQAGATPGWQLWAGAILAGVLFTFSPFHFAHLLGHMQVFSLAFIPFYVLYMLRALPPNEGRLHSRDAAFAALFLILAALCDWYFALYLGLFSGLYLLWLLVRRQLCWSHVGALAMIYGLTGLVIAPLLAPMISESVRFDFMKPPPGQVVDLSADVLGFLIPSGQHTVWGEWAGRLRQGLPASPSENTLFIGVIPLLLAGYGLALRRLKLAFWAIAALVFVIFALGPVLHVAGEIVTLPGGSALPLPYALLLKIPFVEIARTVARYDLLVTLSVGVLAGGGLYSLLLARPNKWLAAIVIALVMFEFSPIPYPVSPPDTPSWYNVLADDDRSGAVLNLPMNWDRPGYLLYQTLHTKPLSAGYISRNDPRTYPSRIPVLSDFRHLQPDINAADVGEYAPTIFEFADIRWVVVDRYKMPGGNTLTVTENLITEIFGDQKPLYTDDRLTVYETWHNKNVRPFIEIGSEWGPLQAGPARLLPDSATIIIHSPDSTEMRLVTVSDADDSTSIHLEGKNGDAITADVGMESTWLLALDPGPNTFTIGTDEQAGILIQSLRLETPDN
ncbi:MAG: hypothetical protein GY759_24805 [Chloroflexi bacterium]|nr:hypothetical protein [Chloroflexota bacterium]